MEYKICVGLLLFVCVFEGIYASTRSDGECQAVHDLFTSHRIGLPSVVPDKKIHDDSMEVCYKGLKDTNRLSCCNRDMERKLHSAAQKDFYETVTATSLFLKNILKTDALEYEVAFVTLVRDAQNQTDRLLGEKHSLPLTERHQPVKNLFADFQAYLKHQEVDLHGSVETFFDELFPLVFRNLVNNRDSMIMTDAYRTCLTEVRQQISPRPFGDAPNAIAHQLEKMFSTSRLFLDALKIGSEVVERAASLDMGIHCTRAVTKLEYCSACAGYTQVKPCLGFCHNVMRGCLVDVTELDKHWKKDYLETLDMLVDNMERYLDMQASIAFFIKKLSEGILHSMETEHKYYQQVYKKCGHPETPDEGTTSSSSTPSHSVSITPDTSTNGTSLFEQMKLTVKNLMSSKLFFRGLADSICTNEIFATGEQEPCWNGETVGSYTKPVPSSDEENQILSNPEVMVKDERSPILQALLDKLISIRKQITSKIQSEFMQMQSDWTGRPSPGSRKYRYGSGDGMIDDEDYNGASGYGSGSGGGYPSKGTQKPGYKAELDDKDIEFTDTDPYITEKNKAVVSNNNNGASSTHSITIATIAISIATLLLR